MLKKVVLTIWAVCAASGVVSAQATATINGRVVDQGGAVLPGATVAVTDAATGVVRDTVTNAEGLYSVPALTPGTYSVKAELAGFAPQARNGIQLITGTTLTVELQLGLASIQETVTVSGQIPLVETTQAVLSNTIQQTEVQQLPMLNRNMAAMMSLLPGAREVPQTTAGAHGLAANYVSFGGGAGRQYNMLVDGSDNKEDNDGGTMLTYSLEGVQEMKVLTTGASAEYGRAATTVLMATKSGTNQLHGTMFGYFRNEKLIATDFFSKPENGGFGKQPFEREQYGGSMGGPLLKDRAWFFGSIERVSQDFILPRSPSAYNELDILTRALPNVNALNSHSIPTPSRDLLSQGKINFQLGRSNSGYVRYSSQYGYVENDALGTSRALLAFNPAFADRNHQGIWDVAGGETWVINPTTVNQFTMHYDTYTHDNYYPLCPNPTTQLGVFLGGDACLPQRLTFPSVSTGVINAFPLWTDLDNKLEFRDDYSKQVGRHALKFGADYVKMPVFGGIFASPSPGAIAFFDDPSVIVNNTNGKYPLGFLTPGIVRQIQEGSLTIGDYSSAEKSMNTGGPTDCQAHATADCSRNDWGSPDYNFGVYAQDDFKVSPRLTLNVGLRFDMYDYIGLTNLPNNRAYQVLKAIGSQYGSLPTTDKNWSPRVGGAWDLRGNGKDVVRASFGLFYQQGLQETYFQRNFQNQSILTVVNTITDSAIGAGPLANYVYGVTPLPAPAVAPTQFPAGGRSTGYWYDPNLKNQRTIQSHVGWSHVLPRETVLAVDYTHIDSAYGWRQLNVNPLINGVRPLAAATQRVYGDVNLLGPVQMAVSVNDSKYDEMAVHFERRFSQAAAFQVNYTLAYARGMGGSVDSVGSVSPQTPSITGGDIYAPWEYGPTAFDERHRVTVAGVFTLPFDISVSPSFTAASARPYTQYRAPNPSGDGSLQILGPDGNPAGINNARGDALVNANARVTKNLGLGGEKKLALFAEFYNILNRANFGNQYFGNAFAPATYNKPSGFLGGIGALSTIANSFQVQFGTRISF